MTQMNLAVQLLLYGLVGVFTVLIVFYGVIRALRALFPVKEAPAAPAPAPADPDDDP